MLVYTLNSFEKNKLGGNPAGVVINEKQLTLQQMQRIAKEVGFSETAFVFDSDKADFRVRFFTPNSEVDLCGHATIAAFSLLSQLNIIKAGQYTMEAMAGVLDIGIDADNKVFMNQNMPEFYEIIEKDEIKNCFKCEEQYLDEEHPVQVVSTGLKDIMLPVKSLDMLMLIKPDMDNITEISKKYNATGIHAFTTQTIGAATAHCRNFAPLYGIPEESATGTANGALACYLYKHHIISTKEIENMIFEQGYCMDKPSEIIARLKACEDKVISIILGGSAVITGKIMLDL